MAARKQPAQSPGERMVSEILAEMTEAGVQPDAKEVALLATARQLVDHLDALEQVIAKDGALLTSSTGVVRVHPAVVEHRQIAATVPRVLARHHRRRQHCGHRQASGKGQGCSGAVGSARSVARDSGPQTSRRMMGKPLPVVVRDDVAEQRRLNRRRAARRARLIAQDLGSGLHQRDMFSVKTEAH